MPWRGRMCFLVIIPLWKLKPAAIGGLISIGYVGQLLGALALGWVAEKRGRRLSLLISVASLTVFSALSGFSWSYGSLAVFRFLQGIGLGGEVPVAASYINEISSAKRRGRFVLFYEMIFPIGLLAAAAAGWWMVPHWGWRILLIGALPGPLIVPLRWMLPESPRWLADRGRLDEADAVVTRIEEQAGPFEEISEVAPVDLKPFVFDHRTRLAELFQGISGVRWWFGSWFAAYFATFGIATWLPTIYTSVFKLPLAEALRYSLITACVNLVGTVCCALLIDRTGRKPWFTGASLGGGILLLVLWQMGASSALQVLVFTTAAYMVFNTGLYLYTPELYPHLPRAFGHKRRNRLGAHRFGYSTFSDGAGGFPVSSGD